MTAIVMPDIDRSTLAELRDRMPSLSEIELPSLERAGREADRAIDRLLGRPAPRAWPRVALGLGLVALVGAVLWFLSWSRDPRPSPAPAPYPAGRPYPAEGDRP